MAYWTSLFWYCRNNVLCFAPVGSCFSKASPIHGSSNRYYAALSYSGRYDAFIVHFHRLYACSAEFCAKKKFDSLALSMNRNLHLTHTDIHFDSRILKEMGSLAATGYATSGIGVMLEEGAQKSAPTFEADI